MSDILLSDIWNIENRTDYKVHFGYWNGVHPLDEWVRDPNKWVGWQEWRGERARWTRGHIFSLMEFHPDGSGHYLFGGVFRCLKVHSDHHKVELTPDGAQFIGRLKLYSAYGGRQRAVNFENHSGTGSKYPLTVKEILALPYTGRKFPGHQNIDIPFAELEGLIQHGRSDWKAALETAKGVYLITDTRTNQRYVGSAYGQEGIWSRWSSYIASGHGGNEGLRALLRGKNEWKNYCRSSFRFALLEQLTASTDDNTVIARESFWKNVLLSRESGLNRN